MYINGVYRGVYISVEQRDKTFMKNRGLWNKGETWLYKFDGAGDFDLKEGDPDSPTHQTLCYPPFMKARKNPCKTPDDDHLAVELPAMIDMQAMLTVAAVNALGANPDAIFSHSNNGHFIDSLANGPRLYYPWDLDAPLKSTDLNL